MSAVLAHIDQVVRPSLREYLAAENALTEAQDGSDDSLAQARTAAMRSARTAAVELHHLSDFALNNPPPLFPDLRTIRQALQKQVLFLREPKAEVPEDVNLLGNIADAFKHHTLTKNKRALVKSASNIVTVSTGYGVARWGEGKWGGAEQVIVTLDNGDVRALSSILQNVYDAWSILLRREQQPLGFF